jgi:hypothetical protein
MHVQVETVEDKDEYLYPNTQRCPKLKLLFKEARK